MVEDIQSNVTLPSKQRNSNQQEYSFQTIKKNKDLVGVISDKKIPRKKQKKDVDFNREILLEDVDKTPVELTTKSPKSSKLRYQSIDIVSLDIKPKMFEVQPRKKKV